MIQDFVEFRLEGFYSAVEAYGKERAITGLKNWEFSQRYRLTVEDVKAIKRAIRKIETRDEV